MEKITVENFENTYLDPIEVSRIDKFVCDEMARQIHRYIKAMKGSKTNMLRFEENIKNLDVEEKEIVIANYIDYNRKVIDGLDFKIVLSRAMANYCDTYDYFVIMLNDKNKFAFYLQRIQDKYIRFHSLVLEEGKWGMVDYEGKSLIPAQYEFLRTCQAYCDDLSLLPVIAQKDEKFGLVLPDGKNTIVADFVYDDISICDEYPYFEAVYQQEEGWLHPDGVFKKK